MRAVNIERQAHLLTPAELKRRGITRYDAEIILAQGIELPEPKSVEGEVRSKHASTQATRTSSHRLLKRARSCLRSKDRSEASVKKPGAPPMRERRQTRNAKGRFVSPQKSAHRSKTPVVTTEPKPSNLHSQPPLPTNNNLLKPQVDASRGVIPSQAHPAASARVRKKQQRGAGVAQKTTGVRTSQRIRSLRYTQQNFARDSSQTWTTDDVTVNSADVAKQAEVRASHSDNVFEFAKTLDASEVDVDSVKEEAQPRAELRKNSDAKSRPAHVSQKWNHN